MPLITAILIGAAGWRIASLLVDEDGPFDIFVHVRASFQPEGPQTGIGKMLTCIWCTGLWTTLFVALIWLVWHPPVILIAASAIPCLLERWTR